MWRGTDRTRSQMILTEYQYDYQKKNSRSVYLVRHNSCIQQTVLEQFLTVDRDSFGRFMPTIELKDFPEGLCDRAGQTCPWQFWNDSDVRTMVLLGLQLGFDPKRNMPFDGVAHNALADARHQAKYVSTIWQKLLPSSDE